MCLQIKFACLQKWYSQLTGIVLKTHILTLLNTLNFDDRLRPSTSFNEIALKRCLIEHSMSYQMMCKLIEFGKLGPSNWILKVTNYRCRENLVNSLAVWWVS